VVDIVHDGRVFCGDRLQYDPTVRPDRPEAVSELLQLLRARPETTTRLALVHGRTWKLVDDPILVRADRDTEWYFVGLFLQQCADPLTAFWKIQLGVTAGGQAARIPVHLPMGRSGDPGTIEYLTIGIAREERGTARPREAKGANAATSAAGDPSDPEGHRVAWSVGPKKFATEQDLRSEIARVRQDRSTWQRDPATGEGAPMPMLVEPQVGVTYGDVVKTLTTPPGTGHP
jgi:hypothetical protein